VFSYRDGGIFMV